MDSATERYNRDSEFHTLVDLMLNFICKMEYTPSEMREAAMLACIMFETQHTRPFMMRSYKDTIPKEDN